MFLLKMNRCKVIVAEECHCFYQGIFSWLEDEPGFFLNRHLAGWDDLVSLFANRLSSAIIVTSFNWISQVPGLIDFIGLLKSNPHCKALCFIRQHESDSLPVLIGSGINGIIHWNATREEFFFGLKEISSNKFFISTLFPESDDSQVVTGNPGINRQKVQLTRREAEVLTLICQGLTDKEIGDRLCISKRTVDGYRCNLLSKFGAKNSSMMVKTAMENHMV